MIDSGALLVDDYVRTYADFADDIVLVVKSGAAAPRGDRERA